jgi:ABC-2 type transport system ATP-binding protein
MRVIEQLCYPGELRGLSRGEVREEAERWLADLGLSDRARDALEDLSLGNRSGCSS